MKKFKEWLCEANGFDSITLFQEIAIQSPNALNKIKKAFDFINQNRIPCVLIGGLAVAHWTSRAITPDVDFLCSDMEFLKQTLKAQDKTFSPVTFNFSGFTGEGIQVPELDADFLDSNKGNKAVNSVLLKTAKLSNIGGMIIPVANSGALAIQKLVTGRKKDIDDAFKLLPNVNKNELKTMLLFLKGKLGNEIDAKTIWNYAKIPS